MRNKNMRWSGCGFVVLAVSAAIVWSCRQPDVPDDNREELENASLKILAIGNSFTEDATDYLPQLIEEADEKSVVIARICCGGTSLENHWQNHLSGRPDYTFQISDNGKWSVHADIKCIDKALDFVDWDIVVVQQLSYLSGIASTYHPYLENFLDLISSKNTKARTAFQMTWAYSARSHHPDFSRYGKSRSKMYRAIRNAVELIDTTVNIMIPTGTLIEMLRETPFNNALDLTRDGYHLDNGLPSYAAACLWHELLIAPTTQKSVFPNKFRPQAGNVAVTDTSALKVNELVDSLLKKKPNI